MQTLVITQRSLPAPSLVAASARMTAHGKLDLRYHATSAQWAEGLAFEPANALAAASAAALTRLTWLTPFDLQLASPDAPHRPKPSFEALPPNQVPSLAAILEALLCRIGQLLPVKSSSLTAVWEALAADDQADLTDALEQASHAGLARYALDPAPKGWPGRWLGAQVFSAHIPGAAWRAAGV